VIVSWLVKGLLLDPAGGLLAQVPRHFLQQGYIFPLDNRQALELIASGAVPVADLITHRLPLERAIEGIHTVARGEGIKVTIET
jgi:hypothetical protein